MVVPELRLRFKAADEPPAAVGFTPVAAQDLAKYELDGEKLSAIKLPKLRLAAIRLRLPASTLEQESVMRMLFAALLAASSSDRIQTWDMLPEQSAGLLLHAIRCEGHVSSHTANALNVLSKPMIVERYRTFGNRWTMPVEQFSPAELVKARACLDPKSKAASMGEWLNSLAAVLDEPASTRPWYCSKAVIAVLTLAALFIVIHVGLLLKTLSKIHAADNMVLLLPVLGLSASAMVAAFAVAVNALGGS